MTKDQQERKYRRFHLGYPVRLKWNPGGAVVEVETISQNVSIGGLLVSSTALIPERTPVAFIISVMVDKAARTIHLTGEGNIVRVENGTSTFRLAVECKMGITQLEDYLPTA